MLARPNPEPLKNGGSGKISIDLGARKVEEEKGGSKLKIYSKDAIIIDDENEASIN